MARGVGTGCMSVPEMVTEEGVGEDGGVCHRRGAARREHASDPATDAAARPEGEVAPTDVGACHDTDRRTAVSVETGTLTRAPDVAEELVQVPLRLGRHRVVVTRRQVANRIGTCRVGHGLSVAGQLALECPEEIDPDGRQSCARAGVADDAPDAAGRLEPEAALDHLAGGNRRRCAVGDCRTLIARVPRARHALVDLVDQRSRAGGVPVVGACWQRDGVRALGVGGSRHARGRAGRDAAEHDREPGDRLGRTRVRDRPKDGSRLSEGGCRMGQYDEGYNAS